MGALASALAERNNAVTFVANEEMSVERMKQGWEVPEMGGARVEFAKTPREVLKIVNDAPFESLHICQGLRRNGLVGLAQRTVRRMGLRHWVILETLENAGWHGLLRRFLYRGLFHQWRNHLDAVLAIGHTTPAWLIARGMPSERVFPFAYFLQQSAAGAIQTEQMARTRQFRFIFVGQLIERKRVAQLIAAVAALERSNVELWIVGTGVDETKLRRYAERVLPSQARWLGRQSMHKIPGLIQQADCLVLPSRHDGWGAVASEALMVGTPVICSDACGVAAVVSASNAGRVFEADNFGALQSALAQQLLAGPNEPTKRRALADWASCLDADAGAEYLNAIIRFKISGGPCPMSPWDKA
jgi:glycosyltransferase involved in cell wall biosynthesis